MDKLSKELDKSNLQLSVASSVKISFPISAMLPKLVIIFSQTPLSNQIPTLAATITAIDPITTPRHYKIGYV